MLGQGAQCPASHVEMPPFAQAITVSGGHAPASSTALSPGPLGSGAGGPPQDTSEVASKTIVYLTMLYVLRELVCRSKRGTCAGLDYALAFGIMAAAALRRRYGRSHTPAKASVVFEPADGWWVASVPGVPGAYSQGKTRDSAYSNLLDAMAGIEAARRDGLIA